jgi:hypothetical protein
MAFEREGEFFSNALGRSGILTPYAPEKAGCLQLIQRTIMFRRPSLSMIQARSHGGMICSSNPQVGFEGLLGMWSRPISWGIGAPYGLAHLCIKQYACQFFA